MATKECGGCHKVKGLDEFHNSSVNEDGKQARCKQCQNEYRAERKAKKQIARPVGWKQKTADIVSYRREYHAKNRARMNELKRDWFQKNKHRESVKNATRYAIKTGKLVRQPCVVCGEVQVEAHHPDYSKPLEVVWLCRTHHLAAHGKVDPMAKKDVAISGVV
jgi:hypothetical protein